MSMADLVVDTSVLVAIALHEVERDGFLATLTASKGALISTVSVVEARIVVHGRRGERAINLLNDLLRLSKFEIVPPGHEETEAAFAAFVTFGKGSGHPAQLNLGDLFSYALAKTRHLPLLFKGRDFAETDIMVAAASAST